MYVSIKNLNVSGLFFNFKNLSFNNNNGELNYWDKLISPVKLHNDSKKRMKNESKSFEN